MWNSGCICGNGCCRSGRSKHTRLAQCYQHGSTTEPFKTLCCGTVLNITLTAGGASVASYGATTPRRMIMRHGGGRGAEAMSRGAEPLGGAAARRRKRASRGYMLPFARVEHGLHLRQRMLPPVPGQRHTSPTAASTWLSNRIIQHIILIFHDREYIITKIFPFVKGYTANLWGWMMKRLSLSLSFFSE